MLLTIEEIKEALKKTLPNIPGKDIERAAQAIIEASGAWQEVDLKDKLGAEVSIQCKDICALGAAHDEGMLIRAFIQRKP